MKHDVLAVLIANLVALAVMLLFRHWRKAGTHIGAYIVTVTVVWAWFNGRLHIVEASACVLGVILMGAEMTGKFGAKKRQPERVRDQ